MFFNFVFMFLWFYPPSAKTETKDTYKIPWWLYVNRGHFYFGQRGQPDFGFRGQINLAAGVIRAWVFQRVLEGKKAFFDYEGCVCDVIVIQEDAEGNISYVIY